MVKMPKSLYKRHQKTQTRSQCCGTTFSRGEGEISIWSKWKLCHRQMDKQAREALQEIHEELIGAI